MLILAEAVNQMIWWSNETTALTLSGIAILLVGGYFESQRRKGEASRADAEKLAVVQREQLTNSIADLGVKMDKVVEKSDEHVRDDTDRFKAITEIQTTHSSRIAQLGQKTGTSFSD